MILDNVLKAQWSNRYENKRQLFRSTLKYIHMRTITDSPFKAYFNLQLIENKAPTQIRDPETELIGEFNEEDANFLNLEAGEFLFRIDLVNGTIIEDENTVDENSDNPVILNTAPICSFHSLIIPFVNSKFQQLLSGFIAESVLNLFKLSSSPYLRIGYNSKLANCSINHLHAHLIYVDQLFDEKRFPVETFQIKTIVTAHNQTLGEVKDYPLRTLAIQGDNIIELLSLTIDTLLSHSIPHNIMFVSPQQAYIYPRKNQFEFIHEHGMRPAFIELSGLLICRNKQYYDDMTLKEVRTKFEELSHPEFDSVVEEIASQFIE